VTLTEYSLRTGLNIHSADLSVGLTLTEYSLSNVGLAWHWIFT